MKVRIQIEREHGDDEDEGKPGEAERIAKPFAGEHRARQTDPAQFQRFARKELAPGVVAILGVKPDGASEVQSVAFDSAKFTPAQAKAWLTEHGLKTDAFEEAVEKMARVLCVGSTDKRLVLAVAMRPGEVDTHGDQTSRDEVQAAMHRFAMHGGVGAQQNVNHAAEAEQVFVVESSMAAADFAEWDGAKLAEPIKRDDWYIVLKMASDALWAQKATFTGVSIEGYGLRSPAAA